MSSLVEERLGWPDAVGDTLSLEHVGGRPRLRLPEPASLTATVCPRATVNHLGGDPLSDVTAAVTNLSVYLFVAPKYLEDDVAVYLTAL